ncbi:nucleotidyltransferase domain-containing protein [Methanosarcinaceae archaeon]|nr:nucleotidyltransferase domain-containing protein [Methanosarcinaceae archaeon]MBQ3621173.1 nucleotidyltransferase domain-containing protein [Methanosarcinaceae archaeon]
MENIPGNKDPRLRDLLVTKDDMIFAVCDYFHPEEGIRAVLRYLPDPEGNRTRRQDGKRFRKMSFDEGMAYMKKHHPEMTADVPLVPRDAIAEVIRPDGTVRKILNGEIVHDRALAVITAFRDAGLDTSSMGITGSIAAGLNDETSDIDFLVYGRDWYKARDILNGPGGLKDKNIKGIRELNEDVWRKVYEKRKSPMTFDLFMKHEIRKGNRGMIGKDGSGDNVTYFDLLFVRSYDMIGERPKRGKDIGIAETEAVVTDDTFAFDSPAIFRIRPETVTVSGKSFTVSEIFSYTHTYAGQASAGEKIKACGILEDLGETARIVIGTKREPENEWIRSLDI